MLFSFDEEKLPRYERQLKNVNHLVLKTLEDKRIFLTMDELYKVLETLNEYRVIE